MCGPTGSIFGLGLSLFAIFFLAMLATLIGNDYQYVGEWFDPKGTAGQPPKPISEQREAAISNLWTAVAVYAALGVVSGIAVCTHRVRGAL